MIRHAMRAGALGLAMLAAVPGQAKPLDKLSAMFAWWDQAFTQPGAYTEQAFDRWFTKDATLTLNGQTVIHGTADWAKHFQAIQGRGGVVEIVVPFKTVFQTGNRIYTYHIIRSRSNSGVPACMLAAGHADLRGDKIAAITLVRHALDPAKGETDPGCFPS